MKKVLLVTSVLCFCVFSSFASAQTVAAGKKVTFDYTLKVDNEVIDSTTGKTPIQYTQGDNTIIPGLAKQMEGLKVGDSKEILVKADEAYGPSNPEAIKEVPKAILPADAKPEVGQVYEFQGENNQSFPGVIKEIKDTSVMVDFNHPLAGKDLTFSVTIVKVE
jgi:FKBP-type peptidyl-prolyl cis-trans isomerase 2